MAEVRALLCLSVLFNIIDRVILCCVAICFMFVLANKINNSFYFLTLGIYTTWVIR